MEQAIPDSNTLLHRYEIAAQRYFPWLLLSYFLLMTLLRITLSGSLERDEAEQMLFRGVLAWGYGPQPPLYTWIQNLFFTLFGPGIAALALLKNLLLFGTYYFLYRSGTLLTRSHLFGAIAAASLFFIPTISWQCQRDLTHTVFALFMVSITFYYVLWIRTKSADFRWWHYLLLGTIIAMGLLSKYNYAVALAALFFSSLIDPKLRRFILDLRFTLTIFTVLLLISPHLYWLITHLDMATGRTLGKMHVGEAAHLFEPIGAFLLSLLSLLAPFLLFVLLLFRKALRKPSEMLPKNYIVTLTLLLLLMAIISQATHFKGRWLAPAYLPVTLYFVSMLDPAKVNAKSIKAFFTLFLTLMALVASIYTLRVYFPDLAKNPPRFVFPYGKATEYFREKHPDIEKILYGRRLLGGNFKLYYPEIPVEKADTSSILKAYESDETTLVIWDDDSLGVAKRLKDRNKTRQLILPYLHSSEKKHFRLYWQILPAER
jgi:4-amino-4-deoxy-L-arabinose transferase-like glycosyltransferase